jgi:hypothetical protein
MHEKLPFYQDEQQQPKNPKYSECIPSYVSYYPQDISKYPTEHPAKPSQQ